jgi:hypothetical protein
MSFKAGNDAAGAGEEKQGLNHSTVTAYPYSHSIVPGGFDV